MTIEQSVCILSSHPGLEEVSRSTLVYPSRSKIESTRKTVLGGGVRSEVCRKEGSRPALCQPRAGLHRVSPPPRFTSPRGQ